MRRRRLLAGAAVAAVLAGGCSSPAPEPAPAAGDASSVGITSDSVTVGAHVPLTGDRALGLSRVAAGTQAYFAWVNARGGVDGREIRYVLRDDAADVEGASTVVGELALFDEVFALVGAAGVATHEAVLDQVRTEGLLDLFVTSGASWSGDAASNPLTFGFQPDDATQVRVLAEALLTDDPDAEVGVLSPGGAEATGAAETAQDALGSALVGEQTFTPGDDLVAQVRALRADGADTVLAATGAGDTARLVRAAAELDYEPQLYLTSSGGDPVLVGDLLAQLGGPEDGADALEGARSAQFLAAATDDGDPWTRLWAQVWAAGEGPGALDDAVVLGMAQGYTFVQALAAAGPNPTVAGVVASLQGRSFPGPTVVPPAYTEADHAGVSALRVVQHGPDGSTEVVAEVAQVRDGAVLPVQEQVADPPQDGVGLG